MSTKRDHPSNGNQSVMVVNKKQKTGNELVHLPKEASKELQEITRTSNLLSPIMLLSGHKAEVLCCRFSHDGKYIASGSFDKTILLWNVYGECENWLVLKGHSNAVLDLNWTTDDSMIFSASADRTMTAWDVERQQRIKKYPHKTYVNTVGVNRRGPVMAVTGSDDGVVRLWDLRTKRPTMALQQEPHRYSITSVSFSDTNDQVFAAGIDNKINIWDLRKEKVSETLSGHTDSVTGVSLSPNGCYLLSNSMDSTVRMWDVRPFIKGERCLKTFEGIQHNFEKNLLRCCWSSDGNKISAGSADRFVYIWDATNRKILYKLPGHKGSVNDTNFHPREPIVASCSNDGNIYLGEIKPQIDLEWIFDC